jgi:crotonobetainyl-CoA:carnitine CoA-transferase CaiB-like acyl-CoA transferase
MNSIIFKDLKIVELASVLAGPSVGMFFAELGAKVVKFENTLTNGDVTRSWKIPNEKTNETSAYFSSINFGKEHILVNYNDHKDLKTVIKTIEDADIVICNFKEGMAEKFNLDYKSINAINPLIIYAQLDGFELQKERVAFDVVLQAECGYMFMNGDRDTPPTKMPLALMDILAAHQMKEGILVALIERIKNNQGSKVVCSLEKSALASLANQASNYLMSGHIPQRIGSLHPNIAPYGEQFETLDKKTVVLAIGADKQFEKLCKILDLNLFADGNYATNVARVSNRNALQEILSKEIKKQNYEKLMQACLLAQVPIGQVKNMQEVFENPVAKNMVLTETQNGEITKRISSIAFKIEQS